MPAGRPRSRGKREKSGRLSRSDAEHRAFEDSPVQVALQARRRHMSEFVEPSDASKWRSDHNKPVSKDEAKSLGLGMRGTILGDMLSDDKITPAEYTAGMDYCERYVIYASTNGLPRPTPQAPSYGEVRGGDRPERIDAARRAKAAHMADQAILAQCGPGVAWAIKRACVTEDAAPVRLVAEGLAALVKAGR